MRYFFLILMSLILMAEGCRPPRCPLPNCYVRMKHRHGGENWKAAAAPSDFDPDRNPNANRGKEFRGVPWRKKNKNPKIGDGYKPGYKYDQKKPKPKKQRKKKDIPEEQAPPTQEEQLMEGEEPQQEEEGAEQAPEETPIQEEPKKKKGLFKKREKKEKQEEAEKPVLEEPQIEKKQQEETEGF